MAENEPSKRTHHPTVFISGTTQDLPAHREAAMDAAWRCGLHPMVLADASTGAADETDPVGRSLGWVDAVEAYVGIFAHRYGSIPPGEEMSIAEMEYRRAVEREIPILIFIVHEEHPAPVGDIEDDPAKAEKLAALKDELASQHDVGFFTSPENLGKQALKTLNNLVRGGAIKVKAAALPDASAIPAPPEPFIAHPYVTPRAFFGRRAELAVLDAWAESDDAVLVVEAIDGVGKSALTWQWACEGLRAARRIPALAGTIWWRFHESDADVDHFLRYALVYVTGQSMENIEAMGREQCEATLLALLYQRPYLLVLDGVERLLTAYGRPDAPRLTDEQVEAAVAQDDFAMRACTNPHDGVFLQRLTQCAPSKALISSRLIPHDLEDSDTGRLIQGVRRLHVSGLDPYDALDLMQYLGVVGDDGDLDALMRPIDYHCLLLGAMAGCIAHYKPAPGNFAAWYEAEGRSLTLADLDPAQGGARVLACALDALAPEMQRFLGQMAASDYPIGDEALRALNPYTPAGVEVPKKAPNDVMVKLHKGWLDDMHRHLGKAKTEEEADDLRERIKKQEVEIVNQEAIYAEQVAVWEVHQAALAQFHAGLLELENRGLLLWGRGTNRYDLHPVIRGPAFERFGPGAGQEAAGDVGAPDDVATPDDAAASGDAGAPDDAAEESGWLSRLDNL